MLTLCCKGWLQQKIETMFFLQCLKLVFAMSQTCFKTNNFLKKCFKLFEHCFKYFENCLNSFDVVLVCLKASLQAYCVDTNLPLQPPTGCYIVHKGCNIVEDGRQSVKHLSSILGLSAEAGADPEGPEGIS